MKASRLPRPTGPARPLPVFSPTELAKKRLRHLSGGSSGSSSSSIAGTPAKVHRADPLPPSPPPIFYSDNGLKAQDIISDASRSTDVHAHPKRKANSKKPNAKGKAKSSASIPPTPQPQPSTSSAGVAPAPLTVPAPPALQRDPRLKGKVEPSPATTTKDTEHRSSPMPSTSTPAPSDIIPDEDDGFTLVTRKKKGKKGRNSAVVDVANHQPGNSSLPDSRPTPAPRTSLNPRQGHATPPTPAPRTIRPSVTVARPQPTQSEFHAFRVPIQEGYQTSYDAVAALEEKYPQLNMRNLIGKDGSSVLIPLDKPTYDALEASATTPGETVKLTKIDPRTQITKGVVMGYPLRMPLSLLHRHPQIEETTRCVSSRLKEETRQVIITVRGHLPPQIDLGNWGTFYTRPYTPEPLRCFKCQRFGHHQARCSRSAVCGICSARHPTQQCLEKFKAKAEVNHKCANCGQRHHVWNPNCPARLQRVNSGRERQVEWVRQQQRNSLVPAPPGTFVWGDQRQRPAEDPQRSLQTEDFPPLQEPANAPPISLPSQQPMATPTAPATQPPPPAQPSLPPGSFIMTKELLADICKQVTVAVLQVTMDATGATYNQSTIEQVCTTITTKILRQVAERE